MKRIKKSTSGNTGESKYNVGYGKPPARHQFKKGHSGNTRGRPKGRKNFAKVLQDVLDAPVNVRQGTRDIKMPAREALFRRLWNAAVRGEPKAMQNLIAVVGKESIFALESPETESQPVVEDDLAIISDFIERQGAEFFEDFHVGNRKQRS